MPVKVAQQVQFASLPVPCVLVDPQGHILAANILAQEHFNTSEKRLLGKKLTKFISPEKEIMEMLAKASDGRIVSADSFYTVQGHRPYLLHFSKQSDENISVILIAEGNRLAAEAESRRHEMAETVARIALERAHEIKNPLAALRGATQFLSEQVHGEQLEIVEQMITGIDRIKERVDSFLQVGPRANVAMVLVNIHALIDDVCKGVEGVRVQRSYDPGIPDIYVHESRFRQAIENLFSNAIEAGSDLIVWETRIEHGVTLLAHQGTVLSIKIISNGQAIPDDIRDRLFEPYVTDKARGNGLGLSIVQQVIQEHGGKVMVHSQLMRTTFTLYVPIKTKGFTRK